jgi:hypothetical protein
MNRISLMLALALWIPVVAGAEPISGEACYRYGAGETFHAAKHVSISLAKRNALAGYGPFAEATVDMRDPELRDELFANLTVRGLKKVRVTRSEEDPAKKEICSAVEAEVESDAVKAQVVAVFNAFQNRREPAKGWLPRSGHLRIVNLEEFPCTFDEKAQCLNVVAECLRASLGERHPIRITWYDAQGLAAFSIKRRVGCERARDVSSFLLRLPPPHYTFIVDLP